MLFTTGTIVAFLATAVTCQSFPPHVAPTASDSRGPCPGLNSLANHGYLPHNGQNITQDILTKALADGVNLSAAASKVLGTQAMRTGTSGTTFDLADLIKHNILEHDGSLSRADFYTGDAHTFNPAIWNRTMSFFPNKTISISAGKDARKAAFAASQASNPTFNVSAAGYLASALETAVYLMVFQDPQVNTEARTEWVKVLFTEERLPFQEGWKRSDSELSLPALLALGGVVAL